MLTSHIIVYPLFFALLGRLEYWRISCKFASFKFTLLFSVSGLVGVLKNNAKSLLEIWFYYYSKRERHFAIILYTNIAVASREWKPRILVQFNVIQMPCMKHSKAEVLGVIDIQRPKWTILGVPKSFLLINWKLMLKNARDCLFIWMNVTRHASRQV